MRIVIALMISGLSSSRDSYSPLGVRTSLMLHVAITIGDIIVLVQLVHTSVFLCLCLLEVECNLMN